MRTEMESKDQDKVLEQEKYRNHQDWKMRSWTSGFTDMQAHQLVAIGHHIA